MEVGMVGEIFAGVSAFNGLLNAAKALRDMDNAMARNTAVIELQGQILAAQEDYAKLRQTVSALEAEVASLKAWDAEKARYELKKLETGAVVYMLKPEERGSEPPHWLYPNCYANGKKGFLQPTGVHVGRNWMYKCTQCSNQSGCEHSPHWN
jgi:hypothetical protein